MTDPEFIPSHVHDEVALLPWYVNGTLTQPDRQRMAHHLESCASCRTELDELSHLKTEIASIYSDQPSPSSNLARSVLSTVARDASTRPLRRPDESSWLDGVDHWLRSLFLPRWIPSLAGLLLVAQAGILLWLILPQGEPVSITTRSLEVPTVKILVVFQNHATEEQIRSLLQRARGRVIDGPSQDGAYIVEVLATDKNTAQQKLEMLRQQADVIRSADTVSP
jgi:anti-sigma factor RsiW